MFLKIYEINKIPGWNLKTEFESKEEESKHSKIFEDWLVQVWDEKDQLLENFYENNSYILKEKISSSSESDKLKELTYAENNNYKIVSTPMKLRSITEAFQVFIVPITFMLMVHIFLRMLKFSSYS